MIHRSLRTVWFVWNGASASFFLYNYVKKINMQITTILASITAMGGLEAVKWLVRYITCRKTDARKEEASVNSMEEENRRKKVDWLEERLTQRDERDMLYRWIG